MSSFVDDLCDRVEKAAREKLPLRPVGGGTKNFYGGRLVDEVIDMTPWSGIIDYEPTELVMTVKAGTLLKTVEDTLAEHNQELAFEPPRFGDKSTIGGAVIAGLSGPSRLARGPVKDYLLGCTMVDGKGQLLHFGGTVMKNVAGYDLSRVLPGSLGTLGVAVDLSIKVMPRAIAQATLIFDMEVNPAIRQINEWLAKPLPINASVYRNGQMHVRLRGAKAAVETAITKLGGQVLETEQAESFWNSVRDQSLDFFRTDRDLWRLSVPPGTSDLALAGDSLIEWGGGLRWLAPNDTVSSEMIRAVANRSGGHATRYRMQDLAKRSDTFHAPPRAMLEIQRRLKAQFDPAGILSAGRMAPLF